MSAALYSQSANRLKVSRPDLFHYSSSLITEVMPAKARPHFYKPTGFWVSVDEPDGDGETYGWQQWCEGESFGLERLRYRHRVVVRDPEALLWVIGESELDAFAKEYGQKQSYPRDDSIRWEDVATRYAGIVIAPYVWTRRLEMMWYYGWDCASGCIWDMSSIEKIVEDPSSP